MLPIILAATTSSVPPLSQTINIFAYIAIGLGAIGVAIGFIIWFLERRSK
ncbi:MAG: hypothetical protein QXF96_02630 [Saccharolobus sp.]